MIKVCHMTSVHAPLDVRIFRKECVSLAKSGYDVTLVETNGESGDIDGVHVLGVNFTPKNRLDRMLNASKAVYERALGINADIYHLHDPELIPYGVKLLKLGKKVIFDSHENVGDFIGEKEYIPAFARKILENTYNAYEKKSLSRFTALISVTPSICRRLAAINPATYQITNYPIVIPSPTAAEKIPHSVCFAGGIKEEWNHDVVLKALSKFPEKGTYKLFGFGTEEYVKRLSEGEGSDCLQYFGRIPHEQVQSEYAECICGMALCSYSKNMDGKNGSLGNTKLFEYMMAGLPVICTDFVLWKDIVEKNDCGICVVPDDIQAVENAMEFIFNNPEKAARMGVNGRMAIERELNWESQEKILLQLYADIYKG